MFDILLQLIPATFYVALTVACASKAGASAPLARPVLFALLIAALLSHAGVLAHALLGSGVLRFGLATATSLTLWLAMLIYALESLIAPLDGLLIRAAPIAAIASFLPAILEGHPQTLDMSRWAFRAHIVVAMLAYSLFTLAGFHALLMAAAERRLHKARISDDLHGMPPLLTLENLLFRLICAAFVLLTLTVGSGILFSEELFGKPISANHKTVFSIAAWVVFGVLLLGRRLRGWRGRTALRWTLAGFICLIFAYVGSRFVIELLLGRSA